MLPKELRNMRIAVKFAAQSTEAASLGSV
jgi:hypothetical protein